MALTTERTYRRNLDALQAYQPDVAALVDTVAIPPGAIVSTGRDGSSTFLVPARDGRMEWFGQSSMPSISATESFANLRFDGRNAVLPGVLTGVEPLVICEEMPRRSALFVVEKDPVNLKLAMSLHDYADLITSGRIVFLPEGDLVPSICELLKSRPGYEMPTHLLAVPQRSSAQMAELQQLVESAGESAARVYGEVMDRCASEMHARVFAGCPACPRIAVICADSSAAALNRAHRISRALDKLEWPYEACLPTEPWFCHDTARMQTIQRSSCDIVLSINALAETVRDALPPSLPTVAWYLPGATIGVQPAGTNGSNHLIAASSHELGAHLGFKEFETDAVVRCDVAADDTMFYPREETTGQQDTGTPRTVLMLVDLPDDRPDSCGITMTSHQALFGTLKRIIPQHIDTPEPMPAEDLVDRAQHEIGVTLEDSSTQGHFAELVRNQLLPGAVARAHAQALSASGVALAIWGKNWTLGQVGESTTDEGIPAGEALNGLFGSSDIAVFPWCRETEMETALDAMAAGLNVVCRAPDEAFEEVFPGLSPLVPHLHLYRTGRELADTVASLQASPDECRERAGVARSLVLAGYCVSHRLLTIVDHVRNRGCTLG